MNAAVPSAVKILLVDDLENNLLALAALLRRDGVELLLAKSGTEALELLLAHPVALALIDVQMPVMDGFELAELMRGSDRTRHVPIIFVTAGASDQRRVFQGYESGAVDFLYKPIDPHILKSKVTVFIELEQQKSALARELDERSETLRMNEMFTAMLGHDLRGPLAAIMMDAVMLEKRAADEKTRRSAGRTLEGAKRMSRMIVEMLDLARARLAGGIPVRREPLDFRTLVERVVAEQRAAAQGHVITLAAQGDFSGSWDADRVAQLVTNLVANAVQHGDASSSVVCVIDGQAPDTVSLTVTSHGLVPPDLLPRIFDPFRSRESYRTRGDGLGLGLYIAEQIARAHGGQVSVESPDPHGTTTFNLRLARH